MGGKNTGEFLRLLGNGRDFGLKHLNYPYQEGEGGIAEALALAEYLADGKDICVALGDNIIENNICQAAFLCGGPSEPRWKPLISLHEGLRQTILWCKSNADWLAGVEDGEYRSYFEKYYENRDSSLRAIA